MKDHLSLAMNYLAVTTRTTTMMQLSATLLDHLESFVLCNIERQDILCEIDAMLLNMAMKMWMDISMCKCA